MIGKLLIQFSLWLVACLSLMACDSADPVAAQRYSASDHLFDTMEANLSSATQFEKVVEIDHSRLGAEAGSPMPPARVLIFSNPDLEARLIEINPLAALDLPLRILAFESEPGGASKVIYNSFDYLVSRYGLGGDDLAELRLAYEASMASVLEGIPAQSVALFARDHMQPDGIVTIESPYGFEETLGRVNAAIDAQGDTVRFGFVDFQAAARDRGRSIGASEMILFGGPGPGGKAMNKAPTLGLDAFCQKFLVWQDESGRTYLSYNDLLALAARQEVGKSMPLRVISLRLDQTFGEALSAD